MSRTLQQSLFFHFAILLIFAGLSFLFKNSKGIEFEKVKIEIKEVITEIPAPKEKTTEPVIQTQQKPILEKPQKIPKKVFGLSKDTLTSEAPGAGVEIKAGNTIAKDLDQEKLDPNDEGSLPIPSEEYLVTQMPKMKKEFRIPYPKEAKQKNIEGVVVMELLIDSTGKVRDVTLISGPGYGLNEAAVSAIRQFEFSAAFIEKKPVAVKIRYGYRFVLN